jgi:hypothetical protein
MRRPAVLWIALALTAATCGDDATDSTTGSVPTTGAGTLTTTEPTVTTTSVQTTTTSTTLVEESGGAVVERDLEYAIYDGVPLTLDLYLPADPAGAPILVTEGFKEIERLVEEGVIVVNVTEEPDSTGVPVVGPDQPMPDNRVGFRFTAETFACAIRFARDQAAELGDSDPTLALMSLSLGGGFVAHVALFGAEVEAAWDEFAAEGGPPRQIECTATSNSTDVDGLLGVAGGYDFLVPIFEGRFGLTYQKEQDPELQAFLGSVVGRNPDLKVRLLHDPAERTIPFENSTMFEAALTEAGYDVELTTFDGGHDYPQAEVIVPILMDVLGR